MHGRCFDQCSVKHACFSFWYALMEPVNGTKNKPEDFKKVNEVLFPNGTDKLAIYMDGRLTGQSTLMMVMNGKVQVAGASMVTAWTDML